MNKSIALAPVHGLVERTEWPVPALITDAGDQAARRFIEFFTANIRNRNTRQAYARAVADFFGWCERHGVVASPVQLQLMAQSRSSLIRRSTSGTGWKTDIDAAALTQRSFMSTRPKAFCGRSDS